MIRIILAAILALPFSVKAQGKYDELMTYEYQSPINFPDFRINYIGTRSESLFSKGVEERMPAHSDFEIFHNKEKSFTYCSWERKDKCSTIFMVADKCFSLLLINPGSKLIIKRAGLSSCK